MNRLIILETIEKESPISRADILRVTKTSSPTVSLVVEHFLKIRTVREAGMGESSGGRKPTLIELNSNGGFIIGIDLGGINIKLALVNLSGAGHLVKYQQISSEAVLPALQAVLSSDKTPKEAVIWAKRKTEDVLK